MSSECTQRANLYSIRCYVRRRCDTLLFLATMLYHQRPTTLFRAPCCLKHICDLFVDRLPDPTRVIERRGLERQFEVPQKSLSDGTASIIVDLTKSLEHVASVLEGESLIDVLSNGLWWGAGTKRCKNDRTRTPAETSLRMRRWT